MTALWLAALWLAAQMALLHGRVSLRGTVAYVAQQAWILNASLRDNIVFGEDYSEDRSVSGLHYDSGLSLSNIWMNWWWCFCCRYQSVLSSCCLRPDLTLLPQGDLTQVNLPVPVSVALIKAPREVRLESSDWDANLRLRCRSGLFSGTFTKSAQGLGLNWQQLISILFSHAKVSCHFKWNWEQPFDWNNGHVTLLRHAKSF